MTPRRIAAFALAAALPAQALSPQAEERIALDRRLAQTDCRKQRDYCRAVLHRYSFEHRGIAAIHGMSRCPIRTRVEISRETPKAVRLPSV